MRRDPKVLLWDAKDAADAIADMTSGKTFEQLVGDIVLRSAVERQFEIVGEALARLARVDESTAKLIPNLPRIIAFRKYPRAWICRDRSCPRVAGYREASAQTARHAD